MNNDMLYDIIIEYYIIGICLIYLYLSSIWQYNYIQDNKKLQAITY